MEEIVTMSIKEIEPARILKKSLEKEITQKQAASLLNLSERQVRKLIKKLKEEGILLNLKLFKNACNINQPSYVLYSRKELCNLLAVFKRKCVK